MQTLRRDLVPVVPVVPSLLAVQGSIESTGQWGLAIWLRLFKAFQSFKASRQFKVQRFNVQ
jgi:hypothetical protein